METHVIAIGIVKFGDNILILKRTQYRHYTPNKWEGVSGFIEKGETPKDTVLREVKEEVGLEGKILKAGKAFEVMDAGEKWIVNPFLVSLESDKIRIDPKEHTEYRWVRPSEVKEYDCVEGMGQNLVAVGLL